MQRIHPFTLFCCALFAALLMSVAAETSAAAQAAPTVTILVDRLNVRSGPGTTYAVVAGAVRGESYTVVGQSGGCAWLQVAKGGKTLGWLSGSRSYVRLNGACSAVPAGTAPAAANPKQGCALLINQLGSEIKLNIQRSDGWQSSWTIPTGARTTVCVNPGSYTARFTAAGQPGSLAFPVLVKGGEYYEIPLRLPGS